jgi:hypothetical protein
MLAGCWVGAISPASDAQIAAIAAYYGRRAAPR